MNEADIENWFTYHAPTEEQKEALYRINLAAKELARAIFENAPECADRTAAIRKVREARMTANAAVVC